jgi:hypothetical protein
MITKANAVSTQQEQQKQKYFIFDCLGCVVGNKKGYRTIRGAQHMRNSKAIQDTIWSTYYANQEKQVASGVSADDLSNHLSSINLLDV